MYVREWDNHRYAHVLLYVCLLYTSHLLIEPGEPGSGVQLASDCPTDSLALNWQRLILTHLAEKTHLGPLTGSPLTDVKITLCSGRRCV